MAPQASEHNGNPGYPTLPLSHNSADSQASALRLILTLFPDWETADGKVEFIRFKEGITNTVRQDYFLSDSRIVTDIPSTSY